MTPLVATHQTMSTRPLPVLARRLLPCGLALALLAPLPARADDKAAAESLFELGRRLMKQGKIAEACPKFAESQRLEPALGTLLNLARCHADEGKTATAWAEYKEALLLAERQAHPERITFAREALSKLEPRLVSIEIAVTEAVPGLVVTRNGEPVGSGAFDVAIAVDPGQHEIVAKAPGYAEYATRAAATKEGETTKVVIPRLVANPDAPAAKAPQSQPTTSAARDDGSGQRTLGFVLGGVGMAALAVGSVTGVMTLNKVSDTENDPTLCPDKLCTPAGRAQLDDAETLGLVSTLTFAGGFAALGAGTILVLTAPSPSSERVGLALTPIITPGFSALTAAGRF
jgi:hypothetical protein